jgi:shikimate dehydrogenase
MPIDGRTRLAFLLGHPVASSLSPAMHQAAFAAARINAAYLPWCVAPERLAGAVHGLRSLENFLGANVTIPHKETVVPLLDDLTPEAEAIGAVNTILPIGPGLVGDNTDGAGFLLALQEELACDPVGQVVAVLGAGGAGRAVAVSLARAGARRLLIVNRDAGRAARLARQLGQRFSSCQFDAEALVPGWRPDQVPALTLLVNAAGEGVGGKERLLVDPQGLPPSLQVYDCRYGLPVSPLLAAARTRGCRTADGLGMLLQQGALAFERWTGRPAPRAAMREALASEEGGLFP